MLPNRIQVMQKIKGGDYTARTEFANWCLGNILAGDKRIYSDQCVFDVDQKDNKQSVRLRETKCPQNKREWARDCEKLTLWCAMSEHQVFDFYHFASPLVTGARYKHILTRNCLPTIPIFPSDTLLLLRRSTITFQFGSALVQNEELADPWIRWICPISWPPCHPDLSSLVFLWWNVEDEV